MPTLLESIIQKKREECKKSKVSKRVIKNQIILLKPFENEIFEAYSQGCAISSIYEELKVRGIFYGSYGAFVNYVKKIIKEFENKNS